MLYIVFDYRYLPHMEMALC